jgi:apolipoprotein D and lipocalin family protein
MRGAPPAHRESIRLNRLFLQVDSNTNLQRSTTQLVAPTVALHCKGNSLKPMNRELWRGVAIVSLLMSLTGCVRLPDGIDPVTGFQSGRYMGTWFAIARLDHRFERGLSRVTAEYSLSDNGIVTVHNRGFDAANERWSEATGRARFVDSHEVGFLKVSFFGPFYGSYVIFDLDHEEYQWAYVTGPNRKYLWLLARTPHVSDERKAHFIQQASELGFRTEELIWVEHPLTGAIQN